MSNRLHSILEREKRKHGMVKYIWVVSTLIRICQRSLSHFNDTTKAHAIQNPLTDLSSHTSNCLIGVQSLNFMAKHSPSKLN